MAQELTVAGAEVKIRHPWGAWALALITLGIYGLVWWFKINRELRDYSAGRGRPLNNDPTLSVLALFPGAIIIVPAIWTYWTTTERVAAGEEMTGLRHRVSPWITLLLALLVFSTHIAYLQYALNDVWREAADDASPQPVA